MNTAVFGASLYPQGRLGFLASAGESRLRIIGFTHHHPKKRGDLAEALLPLLNDIDRASVRTALLSWSLEGVRYRLFAENELRNAPAQHLPTLVSTEWPEWESDHVLALPGTGGAYLLAAYEPAVVKETLDSLKPLSLPSPRLIPLPFLAIRALKAIPALAKQTTGVIELHGDSIDLFIARDGEILGHKRLEGGLDLAFGAIQEKLELKFIGSAAKLVYDGIYDFSENQEALVAPLGDLIAKALAEMETVVGTRIKHLLPLNLGPETKWLETEIARATSRDLTLFPPASLPEFEAECAVAENVASLHPLLLAMKTEKPFWQDLTLGADSPTGRQSLAAMLPEPAPAAPPPVTPAPTPAPPSEPARPSPSAAPHATEKANAETEPPSKAEAPKAPEKSPSPPPEKTSPAPEPIQSKEKETPVSPPPRTPTAATTTTEAAKSEENARTGGLAKKGKGGKGKNKGPRVALTPKYQANAGETPSTPKPPVKDETPTKTKVSPDSIGAEASAEEKKKPIALYAAAAAVVLILILVFAFSGGGEDSSDSEKVVSAPPIETEASAPDAVERLDEAEDAASNPTKTPETTGSASPTPSSPPKTPQTSLVTAETNPAGSDEDLASENTDVTNAEEAIEPEPAEPEVIILPTGGLLVSSTPSGARVFLNGEDAGTTPLVLSRVDVGAYDVRLELDEYAPESLSVEVKEGEIAAPEAITLTRLFANVAISSEPTGVPFSLYQLKDDERVMVQEGVTPQTIEELELFPYEVEFARSGWETRTLPADLTKGGVTIEVATTYVPGMLIVTSEPSGAEVRHGETLLGTTPLTLDDLAPGDYVIDARIDSFLGEPQEVAVVANETTELAFDLVDYDRVFQPTEVDVLPQAATQIEPERVPSILRQETVVVRVVVGPDGVPFQPEIVSSTRNSLNQLTIDTALLWRFQPAQYRGKPVRMLVTIPFVYNPLERF